MRGPDHPHTNTNTTTTTGDGAVHHVTHTPTPGGVDARVAEQIRKDAYKAGVADEKARHKRNPLLTILIALLAVLGVAVVVLAVTRGSFTGAGRTLDAATQDVAEDAREVGREVADETGEGLQDAGRTIEERGEQAPAGTQPARPAAQPAPGT
jgi:hypothetical protein